jgi:D-glycero-D-manno-heptose 1,7-bisphosphate phosphatase
MRALPPQLPRLVLLDRDGVLNQDRLDYVKSPAELVLLPGAPAAVARLNRAGIKVAVVTNQSAVGRGILSLAALDAIHADLTARLAAADAVLDALLFAPDTPDQATERRKPGPGMLREAMARFGVAPADTVMIGDQPTDAEAAHRAGIDFILVRTGKGRTTEASLPPGRARAAFDDLAGAVASLLDGAPIGGRFPGGPFPGGLA